MCRRKCCSRLKSASPPLLDMFQPGQDDDSQSGQRGGVGAGGGGAKVVEQGHQEAGQGEHQEVDVRHGGQWLAPCHSARRDKLGLSGIQRIDQAQYVCLLGYIGLMRGEYIGYSNRHSILVWGIYGACMNICGKYDPTYIHNKPGYIYYKYIGTSFHITIMF